MPGLFSVEVPYINKIKPKPWNLGTITPMPMDAEVVSIRGDIRDYFAAGRMFPTSNRRFSGWTAFVARRSRVLDYPFAKGWLTVRNRYRAWAAITGSNWGQVDAFYKKRTPWIKGQPILIHIGAQWRVRQFPRVAELANALKAFAPVMIIAGERDNLPEGIAESDVVRLVDGGLVSALRESCCVITNDSGPMHLAALLRRRTIVVSRVSAIEEWIPPGTIAVRSKCAPRGYRPDPAYQSENTIGCWPETSEIVSAVHEALSCPVIEVER